MILNPSIVLFLSASLLASCGLTGMNSFSPSENNPAPRNTTQKDSSDVEAEDDEFESSKSKGDRRSQKTRTEPLEDELDQFEEAESTQPLNDATIEPVKTPKTPKKPKAPKDSEANRQPLPNLDAPSTPAKPEPKKSADFSSLSMAVGFTIPTCLHCHKIEGAAAYSTLDGLRAGAGNSLEFVRNRLDETDHGIGGNDFGRPKVFLLSDKFKDAMAYGIINGYEALDNNPDFPQTTEGYFTDEELATWADITWQTCGSCHTDDERTKGRVSAFAIRDKYTVDQIMAIAGTPTHGTGVDREFPFAGDLGKQELQAIAKDMKARQDDNIKSFLGITQSESPMCLGCH